MASNVTNNTTTYLYDLERFLSQRNIIAYIRDSAHVEQFSHFQSLLYEKYTKIKI